LKQQPTLTPFEMASIAANAAESKKAQETLVLDTAKVSYLADYFVVCSGESSTQLKAIADAIKAHLDNASVQPLGEERDQSNKWFLLDYGDIVVHIMHRQERQFYQLENFWNHADVVERELWTEEKRQAS